jgi:hypothetical protein
MANGSKSLVIYSDILVGSKRSVCTNDPTEESYRPNKFQKILYQKWLESTDEITQKPRFKIINGEPFDGPNRKQLGYQSWTTDMSKQLPEAVKLVKQIPGQETILIQGSGYHVDSEGTNYEQLFGQLIKARRYSTYFEPSFGEEFCQIELNGKLFNISHHIGFARWAAYRTTALAREMAGLHFMKDKLGNIGIIVRSHVHYFVHVEFTHTHGFTNPAWKYPDKHLYRGGMGGVIPDVGCTEVIIEPNGKIVVEKHIAELNIKPEVIHG